MKSRGKKGRNSENLFPFRPADGKIWGMAKLPCTREEFEQFKAIHDHFSFFFDPRPEIPDSEYSLRKTELIHKVKDFWPIFQKLCKELGISLEIEDRPLFYTPAAKTNYARAMCDRTDFVKDNPIPKRLLDLDMLVRAIESCTKPGRPEVNMWELSNNLVAKARKEESWQCNQSIMRQVKKIFDELLIHLRKCFGEEIETQISTPKSAETEQNSIRPKCWRIVKKITGWIFKKTSHVIGAVIIAIIVGLIVAILVDIFADFGWIERIKAVIYKILQLN